MGRFILPQTFEHRLAHTPGSCTKHIFDRTDKAWFDPAGVLVIGRYGERRLSPSGQRRDALKGLKKENLRDNMSTTEIVLNMLAEVSTTEISKAEAPETFEENRSVAQKGGRVAGEARRSIEQQTGKPVVTAQNAAQLNAVVVDMIEEVAKTDSTDKE